METETKGIVMPEEEFEEVDFGDKRLKARLLKTVKKLCSGAGQSVLRALSGRKDAKGLYRLLANEKFDTKKLAESVKKSTCKRLSGRVLLLQDTTDVNLNTHKMTEGLGYCSENVLGVQTHTCLSLTDYGYPIGVLWQEYESRTEEKQSLTKREEQLRPIEEKESYRWIKTFETCMASLPEEVEPIMICDREGDFYELYARMQALKGDFIIRASQNRLTETDEKVLTRIRNAPSSGYVRIEVPRNTRERKPAREAEAEVAFISVKIQRPLMLQKSGLPERLEINVVRITEINAKEPPIEWILITSLVIETAAEALKVVEYYMFRWKIERFHYVLKSGCGAEQIQQRSYERIKPMLLIYSVIAVYIMNITYLARMNPDMPCSCMLEEAEWKLLYKLALRTKKSPSSPYTVATAVKYLSELGGYKRAPSDGPPGLKAVWQGLTVFFRLFDILVGQV